MTPTNEKSKRFANWNVKVPKKRSIWKKTIIAAVGIIVVLLLAAIIFSWTRNRSKTIRGREVTVETKPPLPNVPEIKEVQIEPGKPTSQDFIRVTPVLKYPDMQFVKFSYQWYVNGNALSASDSKNEVLDKKYIKKGDDVFCRVKAVRGKIEAKPVDSDSVTIVNSPPVMHLVPVKPFDVPGEFRYTINAEDPDGDPLTYKLLEPRDRGIVIDAKTGVIKWYIAEAPAPENQEQEQPATNPEDENMAGASRPEPETDPSATPTSIRILFEVTDDDDASAKGSIDLNLATGSEISK